MKSFINEIYYKLKLLPKEEKNIFEIMKYPHYENVASNILAFFIDPVEEHGYKDLFLNTLFRMSNIDDVVIENVEIFREVVLEEEKRIDLLINVNNNEYILAIENKVQHILNNDLELYKNSIIKMFPESQYSFLVLGIRKEKTNIFQSITYRDFFLEIENEMKNYYLNAAIKYEIFLKEFIKNMKNLSEGNITMNEKLSLFLENRIKIEELIKLKEEFKNHINNELDLVVNDLSECNFLDFELWEVDKGNNDRAYKFIRPLKLNHMRFFDLYFEDLEKNASKKEMTSFYIQFSLPAKFDGISEEVIKLIDVYKEEFKRNDIKLRNKFKFGVLLTKEYQLENELGKINISKIILEMLKKDWSHLGDFYLKVSELYK